MIILWDERERYYPDRCIECPALLDDTTAGDRCAECMWGCRWRCLMEDWLDAGQN